MKIKITENGPLIVTGGVPLKEKIIVKKGLHYILEDGREFPLQEEYHLCRCGHSADAPFCDGSHESCYFNGKEIASKAPYKERIEDRVEGETMTLLDDGRCAYARFCHRDNGDVWTLTENDDDPEDRKEAIIAANECPSGRLVMIDKDKNVLEDDHTPEILILQDPEEDVSAGIYVKGRIPIESADGTTYEPRNRVTLCRCGHSRNKPFCDASHVSFEYDDSGKNL